MLNRIYIYVYVRSKKNKEEGINFATPLYEFSVSDFNKREVRSETNLEYLNYRLCKKTKLLQVRLLLEEGFHLSEKI